MTTSESSPESLRPWAPLPWTFCFLTNEIGCCGWWVGGFTRGGVWTRGGGAKLLPFLLCSLDGNIPGAGVNFGMAGTGGWPLTITSNEDAGVEWALGGLLELEEDPDLLTSKDMEAGRFFKTLKAKFCGSFWLIPEWCCLPSSSPWFWNAANVEASCA